MKHLKIALSLSDESGNLDLGLALQVEPDDKVTGNNNYLVDSRDNQEAGSTEHLTFGSEAFDSILNNYSDELKFLATQGINLYIRETKQFVLENGVKITFGEIVALAGDFFGLPKYPICCGKDKSEKQKRFMQAYETLAGEDRDDTKPTTEVPQLLNAIYEEMEIVDKLAKANPTSPHPFADANRQVSSEQNIKFSYLTTHRARLFSIPHSIIESLFNKRLPILSSRYIKLLKTNFDHFVPDAHEVYCIGHELAVATAKEAKIIRDQRLATTITTNCGNNNNSDDDNCDVNPLEVLEAKLLVLAITLEASAAHFSSDAFTSGHMRVPRRMLHENASSSNLGDALAHKAHDDDAQLWVNSVKHPTSWLTCGDGRYFEENNYPNAMERIVEFLSLGLKEVLDAYRGKTANIDNKFTFPDDFWPKPESPQLGKNKCELFRVVHNTIMQRDSTEGNIEWYKQLNIDNEGINQLLVEANEFMRH